VTVAVDTFFAFRSFLVEEENFQLPLSVRSLLTWRARVKRNPLVTVKIRVAGLSWARNNPLLNGTSIIWTPYTVNPRLADTPLLRTEATFPAETTEKFVETTPANTD